MLTKTQKETIERIAQFTGEVTLYEETSFSGKSETLRYCRRWIEAGRYGSVPRTQSGMILSVKIKFVNGKDDPEDWKKYEEKCQAARKLFEEKRKEYRKK